MVFAGTSILANPPGFLNIYVQVFNENFRCLFFSFFKNPVSKSELYKASVTLKSIFFFSEGTFQILSKLRTKIVKKYKIVEVSLKLGKGANEFVYQAVEPPTKGEIPLSSSYSFGRNLAMEV